MRCRDVTGEDTAPRIGERYRFFRQAALRRAARDDLQRLFSGEDCFDGLWCQLRTEDVPA